MFQQYINGKIVEGKGAIFDVFNPANDEVAGQVCAADSGQATEALEAADRAFDSWRNLSLNQRLSWMQKLRNAFLAESDKIVELVSCEIGKPIGQAKAEMDYLINCFDFYMNEARVMTGEVLSGLDDALGDGFHHIYYQPVGVTVGHLAWNFPLHNAGLKMGPALASGCTLVLKPSSKSPLSALYLGEIAAGIGFPAGVLNIISGPSSTVAKTLNQSRIPRLITLIGSSETGLQVMQEGATNIKQYSLELGGNTPFIVAPDADIDAAASFTVMRKTRFSGQGCGSINRVYVHESVHDEYVQKVLNGLSKVNLAWGAEYTSPSDMGPVIDHASRDRLFAMIEDAKNKGANLLFGGDIPAKWPKGSWINPTLLDDVTDDMDIVHNEIFGPVISVLTYTDFDEMIKRANNTSYGLTSYLFSHDMRLIAKCTKDLAFGEVLVNAPPIGVNMPHIGIKESGIGCDGSKYSFREYFQMKRVSIKP